MLGIKNLLHAIRADRLPINARTHADDPRMEWAVAAAIGLAIVSVVLRACHPNEGLTLLLNGLHVFIWIMFAVEAYVLYKTVHWRRNLLEYMLLVLTLPLFFLPPTLIAVLQVLWLFRLTDLLKMFPRYGRVLTESRVGYAVMLFVISVLSGGLAFSIIEAEQGVNAFDGIWWAEVTIASVGYGDLYPKTVAGRLLAMVLIAAGMAIFAVFVAAMLPFLEERQKKHGALIANILDREGRSAKLSDIQDDVTRVLDEVEEVGEQVEDFGEQVEDVGTAILRRLDEIHSVMDKLHKRVDALEKPWDDKEHLEARALVEQKAVEILETVWHWL